ncbi:flavin-containing monooxygenase [Nocardioides insulae]|uniref:flavin-containing monooxygenase n=1 Tax=Nocardioides insulae TaxID=394734 RepID=UPI00041CED81|nr:NAD(P)/FAD-dependent oxidoreductase [Nocardioides insulae]
MTLEHVDVLIVGAGLSGIGAAAQLRSHLPHRSVAVLESRAASGGTWDLFRYPGIRSDSDMFTFGFAWRPWPGDQALADGPAILDYLRTVSQEYGVEELIRFRHTVTAADYDTAAACWTVTVRTPEGEQRLTTDFLWACAGYYDYEQGHQPDFPGLADFEGAFIHPQHWPEDLEYAGKKVVVIGSGATAVTLVPAMAAEAEHVTMLQRTPTYVLSRAGRDPVARRLGSVLDRVPDWVAFRSARERVGFGAARWANIAMIIASYQIARRRPERMKQIVRAGVLAQLTGDERTAGLAPGEAEEYVERHFTPPYEPWDQRLCFVPDGDLFEAIRAGRASVVTDRIRTFTAKGVQLESGDTLEADIVVSATGLRIRLFGGLDLTVDGEPRPFNEAMAYKAMMLSGIPNFAFTIGYTNASWTLKADLVADHVVRLLGHMERLGHRQVLVERDPSVEERPFMGLTSGYITRALDRMPSQGDRAPWALKQNYLVDLRVLRAGRLEDGPVRFS